jgi:hypothetical protein
MAELGVRIQGVWIGVPKNKHNPLTADGKLPNTNKDVKWAGYLYKEGSIFSTWQKRYFVLTSPPCAIHYYQDETSADRLGYMLLAQGVMIDVRQEGPQTRPFAFKISTPSRQMFFCAETEQEKEKCMRILQEQIQIQAKVGPLIY